MLIPFAACSQSNNSKTITWREETKLSGGQIVIVDRSNDFRSNVYAGGGDVGLLFQRARIKAVMPPLNKEVMWEGTLAPLAFDISNNGDIYLVTTWETLQNKAENSVPNGVVHVAFKYTGAGQWMRLPVESVPHEIHPNLLIDEVALFNRDGHSTKEPLELAVKERLNANPAYDKSLRSWPTK
jgi:hypothetical protein